MKNAACRTAGLLLLAALLPACGTGGGSGTLNPTIAPGIPSNVEVRPGSRSVTVTWSSSATGASYVVLRSLNREGPYFPISTPAGFVHETTYVDGGLSNGTTYYYAVQAANAFGSSGPSSAIDGTPGFRPVLVSGGSTALAAVLPDGTVWTWGKLPNNVEATAPAQLAGLTDVIGVSMAFNTAFAVRSDGRVLGWGSRYLGSLGDGIDISTYVPPALNPFLTGITAVAAHTYGGLAIRADGRVLSWGGNDNGQLGNPAASNVDEAIPLEVPGLSEITAIAGAGSHCLALRKDGLVYGWGTNSSGESGIGSTTPSTINAATQVVDLNGVVAIAAGFTFSLALRKDGTVWGWGQNVSSVLGSGAPPNASVLRPIQIVGLAGITAIDAGSAHGLAVNADGKVYSWGDNSIGQLGTGSADPSPKPVPGLPASRSVAASSGSSVALGVDGSVWTWGDNSGGQLGNSTGNSLAVAQEIGNFTGATAIGTGRNYSLITKSPGTVWGCGDGTDAKLGSGAVILTPVDTPVQALGLTQAVSAKGSQNCSLALNSNGTVIAWGSNLQYQLGLPPSTSIATQPGLVPGISGVAAIFQGWFHSLALRNDGTVWTWGNNNYGQLGYGGGASYTPTPVPGLTSVTSAGGGVNYSLALRDDGSVWSWGSGPQGELGTGVLTGSSPPTQIPGLSDMRFIAGGESHCLAVRGDGTVWAWGANEQGKLGVGDTDPRSVPTQVLGVDGAVAVAAGTYHSLAMRNDGTVWAWGDNRDGQLGNPGSEFSSVPVKVLELGQVAAISTGNWHSLALKSNGTVWAWGKNDVGQLGRPNVSGSPVPVPVGP